MLEILKKGLSDTFTVFGGFRSAFITVLAMPICGFAVGFKFEGKELMSKQIETWLIYGLAGVGVVFIFLLLWNFLCAPYRIERDEHIKTKEKLEESEQKITDLQKSLEDENPVRVDPTSGATVIGKRGGHTSVIGGSFTGGIIIGGSDDNT